VAQVVQCLPSSLNFTTAKKKKLQKLKYQQINLTKEMKE
jgi:hypothetical protein